VGLGFLILFTTESRADLREYLRLSLQLWGTAGGEPVCNPVAEANL
jgi:hypothetical protein